MPLYTGLRDSGFVKGINRELIHAYISTEVAIYKVNLEETEVNIYDESTMKSYNNPVRVFALISSNPKQLIAIESGITSTKTIIVGLIKSDLKDKDIFLEEGDIIEFDAGFFEVDLIRDGYWSGRNPDTNMGTRFNAWSQYGYDISILAECHQTNLNSIHIKETTTGINPTPKAGSYTKYIY